MQEKIVVIGSSNIDLIMKMDRLPRPGETVTEAEFLQVYGGKGANQAVAAARAGGNVYFVNCVGEDDFTTGMLESFRKDGLHLDYVHQVSGIPSGTALIMVDSHGENCISVAPGANNRVGKAEIDRALPVIDECALIVLQYEIPAATIEYVLEKAAELGKAVVWNFAPAREFRKEYLNKVDFLILNETEAAFLTGLEVESEEEVKKAADALHQLGVSKVVLTLGKRGAFYSTGHGKGLVKAYNVKPLDTTAAGDVFCGCLSVALVEGRKLEEAIQFANAAAAISVTRMGAQPSAPYRHEIEKFLTAE